MNQTDANGWTNIHYVAYKGLTHSLEKLISADKDQLEMTTNDELRSTPLLLAVMSGKIDTVKELINLGSQIHARNSQGHGIIELCCLRRDISTLKYFLDSINENTLPVWSQLVDFVGSRDDEESQRASYAIYQILVDDISQDDRTRYEDKIITAGICHIVTKVAKGLQSNECKKQALLALLQVIHYPVVRQQFIDNHGLEVLLPMVRLTSTPDLAKISVQIMDILIMEPDGYSEKVFHSGAVPDLNKILQTVKEIEIEVVDEDSEKDQTREFQFQQKSQWQRPDLLKEIVQFFGNLAEIHPAFQTSIGREVDCIPRLSSLFYPSDNRSLILALTLCVRKLAANNDSNKNAFMKEKVEDSIINLLIVKDQTIQMAAVDTIYALAYECKEYQLQLMGKNVHKPLLMILKKSARNITVNEKTSLALWSLAGETRDSKATMASYIGVDVLVDYLQTSSNILQLIGSESIFVLSGGPLSQRDVIAKKNGVAPLVNLLKSNDKEIVISCIRSLRQLCVSIGYIPHQRNQQLVILTRGLQMLVGLMRFCEDELVQVEAAYTIASVCLRNDGALTELHSNPKFNYVYILEKMYSATNNIRLLASASLAAFAYNNLAEQKLIAMCGGIRFTALQPFLFVTDERERLMSAFQMIVLARVIPDEELATSTSWGIKVLFETLSQTKNADIQELGCDCVARLCHTRAGIANGLISLGIINLLCEFMLSYTESVRGSAAIAVEYLSHYPESRRQILRSCRKDPYLMKVIEFYKSHNSFDPEFIECWRHYKKIRLPKIAVNRPLLTARENIDLFKDFDTRQITLFDSTTDSINIGSISERQLLPKLPKIRSNPIGTELTAELSHREETLTSDNIETIPTDSVQHEPKTVSFQKEETDLFLD